jgi:hypothetical protein
VKGPSDVLDMLGRSNKNSLWHWSPPPLF